VIEKDSRGLRYITSGCVKSGAGDLATRLKVLLEGLREVIAQHGPVEVAVEKVFVNIQRYGNTSAASIPIAIAEAEMQGRLRRGNKVLLVAFFAAYLVDKRELLTFGRVRVGRWFIPSPRDLGPLLLAWGMALVVLGYEKETGALRLLLQLPYPAPVLIVAKLGAVVTASAAAGIVTSSSGATRTNSRDRHACFIVRARSRSTTCAPPRPRRPGRRSRALAPPRRGGGPRA